MKQCVSDYSLPNDNPRGDYHLTGISVGTKAVVEHAFADNIPVRAVPDTGFGVGGLGRIVNAHSAAVLWQVDGIDGSGVAELGAMGQKADDIHYIVDPR